MNTEEAHHHTEAHCCRCGRHADLMPLELVRLPIRELIEKDHPACQEGSWICRTDLNRYRAKYVQTLLEEERGELTGLEREVLDDLAAQQLTTHNPNAEIEEVATLGDRLADRLAAFGGSWRFILTFAGILVLWIAVNSLALGRQGFDPYPYILLNLVLSCLAALQAPVIMMSQNRQEAKDRLRSEHDYQVNLKSEIEIRMLSERLDRLITHQWQRLLDIQEIQVELMEHHEDRRHGGQVKHRES